MKSFIIKKDEIINIYNIPINTDFILLGFVIPNINDINTNHLLKIIYHSF